MAASGATGDGRHRGGRGRARRHPAAGRVRRPAGRFPHRGRVGGHRPHARPGEGMGDHDIRHRRQARAVGARAGGDRGHRRGRRLGGERAASRSAAPRSCWPAWPGAAAVLSRRTGDRSSTSCPLSSAPCAASRCCALLTSGRFTDEPDDPHGRSDVPDRGRRLSLSRWAVAAGAVSGVVGAVLSRATISVAGDRDAFALPAVDVARPADPADGAAQRCCPAVASSPATTTSTGSTPR